MRQDIIWTNDGIDYLLLTRYQWVNTLRPRQNGRHFADDTFNHIFVNENVRISIKFSLKFVPKGPINNIPALVQIMAWRRPGAKPLSETVMVSLLTHICLTRHQWVNTTQTTIARKSSCISVRVKATVTTFVVPSKYRPWDWKYMHGYACLFQEVTPWTPNNYVWKWQENQFSLKSFRLQITGLVNNNYKTYIGTVWGFTNLRNTGEWYFKRLVIAFIVLNNQNRVAIN